MATATNDYSGAENALLASLAAAGDVTPWLPVAADARVIASALGGSATWTGSVLLDRQSNLGKGNAYFTGQALTRNVSGTTGQETTYLISNTNGKVRLRASSDFASGPVEVELVVSYSGRVGGA